MYCVITVSTEAYSAIGGDLNSDGVLTTFADCNMITSHSEGDWIITAATTQNAPHNSVLGINEVIMGLTSMLPVSTTYCNCEVNNVIFTLTKDKISYSRSYLLRKSVINSITANSITVYGNIRID